MRLNSKSLSELENSKTEVSLKVVRVVKIKLFFID